MDDAIVVLTNTPTRDHAQRIADALVDGALAAAVQVAGAKTSTYVWRGRRRRSREWTCVIKSVRARLPEIERVIKAIHPYELPAIVALPVCGGSAEYLEWWLDRVAGGAAGTPRRPPE